jgi:hypothetical protein
MKFLLNVQEMSLLCILKEEHGPVGVRIVAGFATASSGIRAGSVPEL